MFPEPMAVDRKIYEVSQGLAKTFTRKIYDENSARITGFTGNEKITVDLWQGDTGEEINGDDVLTANWVTPSEGEYLIGVPALTILPGMYSFRAVLDPNGGTCWDSPREIFRGFLKMKPSPGYKCIDSLKNYCSYADLLEKAPFLEHAFTDTDLSGFARQRVRAREWVDMAIIRNAPNTFTSWYSSPIFYGVFPPGYSAKSQVAEMLKKDQLTVTRPIRDAATHYAIFLICDALNGTPTTGGYGEVAAKHYSRACSTLDSTTAEFRTCNTDRPDYVVDLRLTTGRV